jgi:hypothetical protein
MDLNMSKWIWFYELVEQKLGDLLEQHHFKKLTGKAYEEDENKDTHGIVMYASDKNVKVSIELLSEMSIVGNAPFYLVRVYAGMDTLKQWLYPNIRSQTSETSLWEGWKCSNKIDVEKAFDEIAVGLKQYLNQPQE